MASLAIAHVVLTISFDIKLWQKGMVNTIAIERVSGCFFFHHSAKMRQALVRMALLESAKLSYKNTPEGFLGRLNITDCTDQ